MESTVGLWINKGKRLLTQSMRKIVTPKTSKFHKKRGSISGKQERERDLTSTTKSHVSTEEKF